MAPVLGVPFLNGPSLLQRLIESIDIPVRLLVIDNGRTVTSTAPCQVLQMPTNLGVAASWNLIVKAYPTEPFWLIANHDTVLHPGDLDRVIAEVSGPGPRWVGMNGDWRIFGINAECIETVGLFDETFHPIYCEDADYEYRCRLMGVPFYHVAGGATHVGSATVQEPRYGDQNARTSDANRTYYRAKWGGHVRGGETFTTPYDLGGSPADWHYDLRRIRDQQWT